MKIGYFFNTKMKINFLLFILAVIIGVSTFWYTNGLLKKLKNEEKNKMEIWAAAQKHVIIADSEEELGFYLDIIKNNNTIPVIVIDSMDNILSYRNIKIEKFKKNKKALEKFKQLNPPIEIILSEDQKLYLYYSNSIIIKQLTYYPIIFSFIIVLFILVSFLAFNSSQKAEQNSIWIGLTRETAHQLGTPISSLLALLELIKLKNNDDNIINELEKDVRRLEKIADRFSKIGSKPSLKLENLQNVLMQAINYIKSRTSNSIDFRFTFPEYDILIPMNAELFEWVIENVCKNAIDAVNGTNGIIKIEIIDHIQIVYIDITDNGKGLPKSKYNEIFKPGYTTKERGWGLGLSLSKRIIEDYHGGKIFVHSSEIGKGTTIRIVLKKFFRK